MAESETNAARERRVSMEIIVDACGLQEQAMGETRPRGCSVRKLWKEGQ